MIKRPTRGITCPICHEGKTEVTNSRAAMIGDISTQRRRRQCTVCGHRFSTVELSGDYLAKLEKQLELTNQIAGALKALEAIP